jgi:hypothetical protein
MQGILVPLGFFAMITAIVLVVGRYRHNERMEMIRTGRAPLPAVPGRGALLWGLVLTLVGLGHGVATLALGISPKALMGTAIAVPIGVALLLYYRSTRPDREEAEQLHQQVQAG